MGQLSIVMVTLTISLSASWALAPGRVQLANLVTSHHMQVAKNGYTQSVLPGMTEASRYIILAQVPKIVEVKNCAITAATP